MNNKEESIEAETDDENTDKIENHKNKEEN